MKTYLKDIEITITDSKTGQLLDTIDTNELEQDLKNDLPDYELDKRDIIVEIENSFQSIENWKQAKEIKKLKI